MYYILNELQSHFSAHAVGVPLCSLGQWIVRNQIPISAALQLRRHKLDPCNSHQQ